MTPPPTHAKERQAYLLALAPDVLPQYVARMQQAVAAECAKLCASGQQLQLFTCFKSMAPVSLATLLDEYDPDLCARFLGAVTGAFPLLQLPMWGPIQSQMSKQRGKMDALFEPAVAKLRQRYNASSFPCPSLTANLAAARERVGLRSEQQFYFDNLISLTLSNNATLPSTLYHMVSALKRFPRATEKLRQAEVERKFGAELSWESLEACVYAQRWVLEVLRTAEDGMGLQRVAMTDLDVAGYFVPKGSRLSLWPRSKPVVPQWASTWLDFEPDRFIADPSPREFRPFGTGPRTCIGRALGMLQMRVIAWELARSYDAKGVSEGKGFHEVPVKREYPYLIKK